MGAGSGAVIVTPCPHGLLPALLMKKAEDRSARMKSNYGMSSFMPDFRV